MKHNEIILRNQAHPRLTATATTSAGNGSSQLFLDTGHGTLSLGPGNATYSHFDTSVGRFYFNKRLIVNEGIVSSYDEDLILQRAENTSHQMVIDTTEVSTPLHLDVEGNIEFTSHSHQLRSQGTQNAELRTGAGGAGGLLLRNTSGGFLAQLYGDGSNYGFLDGAWSGWDIQKAINGKLYLNGDTTYFLQPEHANSAKFRSYVQIGDSSSYGTNSGSWGARLNVTDDIHAKIEVGQDANGMLSHWYAHTGQTSIKFGTASSHDVEFQRAGSTSLEIEGGGIKAFVPFRRSSHHASGFLEGSYNNVGANGLKTNPIYTIGSSYNPNETSLGNMYGIGYARGDASYLSSFTGASNWGLYVAADGDARIWLDAQAGQVMSTGGYRVNSTEVIDSNRDLFARQGTFTHTDHNYLKIEASINKEQMVRFKNSATNYWYAGIRTSAGIASTADFHFYSGTLSDDAFAINTSGDSIVKRHLNVKTGTIQINGTDVIDASRNVFPANLHFGGATNQSFINGGSNIQIYGDNVIKFSTYAGGWAERVEIGDSQTHFYNIIIAHGSADWNETTQGASRGSIHLDPGSATNNHGGAITWGASDTGDGNSAHAGIYVRSDGNYGTKMYISTTDNYGSGSKTAVKIDHSGHVTLSRGNLYSTTRTYIGDGSLAAPAYSFGNDSNTGMWRDTNDSINFAAGGVDALQMNSSSQVVIGGKFSNNSYSSVSSTRLGFGGGSDLNHYFIGTNVENYGGNYTKLDLRWHTGIRMGAQASYGGIRFFNNENLTTVLFSIGKGDTTTRVESGALELGSGVNLNNVDGYVELKRTANAPLIVDRLGTSGASGTGYGDQINFKARGTKNGAIGYKVPYGGIGYRYSGDWGLGYYSFSSSRYVQPCDASGGIRDNQVDLGSTGSRFDDVYATNGTIQTSDINEKQDVQTLTTAEQAAAVACKALVRRFRWIDSVEEKGDDARYHFGVIAQDVEAAFTAQGLDAGRYGLFIRTNWWEHENTWYPSEEAAPTGAVEKTRLGIRYNQLLAFIISAL